MIIWCPHEILFLCFSLQILFSLSCLEEKHKDHNLTHIQYIYKFWPDVGNNPSNLYIQSKQISSEIKLCVIKWNDTGKKYWTAEMYLTLRVKAFVGNDSFKTPPGETSRVHALMWFWPILPHSLQISKVLWASSMNSDLEFLFSIGFKSGEWLGHSGSFIFFFWNQSRVSLAVFGIIVLLKCQPLLHHHPCTVGVGTEPANINFHWQGAGLLSNYWKISAGVLAFSAFLHLPFFMCSILFPCVIPFYYTT